MRVHEQAQLDELLPVAHRIFSDEGFGVSTDYIARSAKVRESDIRTRFETKGELFLAAMAPPANGLEAALEALEGCGDLEDQLCEIVLRFFDYFRELAPILFVLATDLSFDYEEARLRLSEDPLNRLHDLLAGFLGNHADLRGVSETKLNAAVLNILSTLHSLAFFEVLGAFGETCSEEVLRQQAALFARGLLDPVPE
jgi:AcrR family transcriptional regulator